MFRLIIVDDESATRKFLSEILDWNELGIEFAGSFFDGQSALSFIENNKVDIVLTDIKMSPMSGLELAKKLHEKYPQIFVVIMSAYRDFEYARESIKYNVFDYILKPITYDGFYEVFYNLSQTIKNTNNEQPVEQKEVLEISLSLILSHVHNFLTAVNSQNQTQIQNETNIIHKKFGNNIQSLTNLANCLYTELCGIYGQKLVHPSVSNIKFLNKTSNITEIKTLVDDLIALAMSLRGTASTTKSTIPPIEQALQFIEEHCHEQITRNDVARHVSLSPDYFSRYFHSQINETFSNYLKQARIKRAKHLLRNTNHKIKEISNMCGIKKTRYFSELFKTLTGVTPQEYRSSTSGKDVNNTNKNLEENGNEET